MYSEKLLFILDEYWNFFSFFKLRQLLPLAAVVLLGQFFFCQTRVFETLDCCGEGLVASSLRKVLPPGKRNRRRAGSHHDAIKHGRLILSATSPRLQLQGIRHWSKTYSIGTE